MAREKSSSKVIRKASTGKTVKATEKAPAAKSRIKSAAPKAAPATAGKSKPKAKVEVRPVERSVPAATNGKAEPSVGRNGGVIRFTETGERLRKTNLSPADLDEFRQLLLAKRGELIGDMNHLRSEALGHGSSGENGGTSSMPIHMADLGSDTWEQELTLRFIENDRGTLREIEEALERIEDKTYGICLATNKPISKARLRATPWARHCIEYARKRELRR